jgi:hypothetical protein
MPRWSNKDSPEAEMLRNLFRGPNPQFDPRPKYFSPKEVWNAEPEFQVFTYPVFKNHAYTAARLVHLENVTQQIEAWQQQAAESEAEAQRMNDETAQAWKRLQAQDEARQLIRLLQAAEAKAQRMHDEKSNEQWRRKYKETSDKVRAHKLRTLP